MGLRGVKKASRIPIMATHPIELGPAGQRVAAAVQVLRVDRKMTQTDLALAMAEAGRPIIKSGVNKLEQGKRRVDADDLMALALALDVSPLRLLLPIGPMAQQAPVTETRRARVRDIWPWARGERPLPRRGGTADEGQRFQRANQPDQQPMSVIEAIQYADELRQIAGAIASLEAAGLSRESILATVQRVDILPTTTNEKGVE